MNIQELRRSYATEIALRANIKSPRLVRALAEIPREQFLGPGPWTIVDASLGMRAKPTQTPDANPAHIYKDASVALDLTRSLYNGAPSILAGWIDALELREGDRVFHLGAGTGYYSAIMASVVGPEGHVLAFEVDEELGRCAQVALAGYPNVEPRIANGAFCDPGQCDAILINAGVTHPLPLWLDRLNDGARLLAPLTFELPGLGLGKGAVLKVVRQGTQFSARFLPAPIVIFPCAGVRDATLNENLLTAFSTRTSSIHQVQALRPDPHERDSNCWVHSPLMCLSVRPLATI